MRKLFVVAIFFLALIYLGISCQKEVSKQTDHTFNSSFVKEWYYGTFKKSPEWVSSPEKGKKLPVWEKGIYSKIGNLEILEYPLVKAKSRFRFLNAPNINQADLSRIAEASLNRLLFIKTGKKIIVREINYMPDIDYLIMNNFDISHNRIDKIDNNFSGMIVTKNWMGTEIKRSVIKSGKITASIKIPLNSIAGMGNRIQSCQAGQTQVTEYARDCELHIYGDGMVTYECGPWYPTGNIWCIGDEEVNQTPGCSDPSSPDCFCELIGICEDPNGGGDIPVNCSGIEDDLENFANAGNTLSEEISTTTISSSPNTRTVNYKWRFYGVYAPIYANYEFTSQETGIHSYPNLTPSGWKFTSLTHNDINVSGQSLNWDVECQNLSSTPLLFEVPVPGAPLSYSFAKMTLDYSMKFSVNCGVITLYKSRQHVSFKIWNVD